MKIHLLIHMKTFLLHSDINYFDKIEHLKIFTQSFVPKKINENFSHGCIACRGLLMSNGNHLTYKWYLSEFAALGITCKMPLY